MAGWWFRPGAQTQAPTTAVAATPLTTYPGREISPSFSPNGDRVVFAWEGENRDNWDIYVRLIGEDTPQQLTDHQAEDFGPAWSPDGRWIAFMRRDRGKNTSQVMLVPSIGGPERPVLEGPSLGTIGIWNSVSRYVAWHPDGEHLVVSHIKKGGSQAYLYAVILETGSVQRLITTDIAISGDTDPAVSPDGHHLAFRRRFASWASAVYVVDLTDSLEVAGEPRNLSGELYAYSPAWMLDGKEIIFAAGSTERPRLWRVSAVGGEPRRIVQPSEGAFPALSPAGNRGALALVSPDFDVWQARLPDGGETKPLISSTYLDIYPKYSPDGNRIAFSSSRSGCREIWVCDSDGSSPVQLTDLESVLSAGPYWSRDGQWIYFSSNPSGEQRIWKMAAEGGEAVPVTSERGGYALESLDGQTLYFSGRGSLWSIPVEGGNPLLVIEQIGGDTNMSLSRDGIYFRGGRGAQRSLDFYDFQTKKGNPLLDLPDPTYNGVSVSPDGKTILFVQGTLPESDIVLVDEFR